MSSFPVGGNRGKPTTFGRVLTNSSPVWSDVRYRAQTNDLSGGRCHWSPLVEYTYSSCMHDVINIWPTLLYEWLNNFNNSGTKGMWFNNFLIRCQAETCTSMVISFASMSSSSSSLPLSNFKSSNNDDKIVITFFDNSTNKTLKPWSLQIK